MKMRRALLQALRGDLDLVPRVTESLRQRIDEEDGAMSRMVQAAEVLEPVIAEAVRKNPSRLAKIGLKSAHLIANLAVEDRTSNKRLVAISKNSSVGIVFVDVADFTRFTAENGDEAAIALLAEIHPLVGRAASLGKGEIVKHLGDGYLLAFPSASQAVRAALTLQDAVRRYRRAGRPLPVRLRVAVHAGEPLLEQDDLLGHDVNLTARLLDHCAPEETVVSAAAKELAERRLRSAAFEGRRAVKIRGLATPVLIYSAQPREDAEQAAR